MSKLDSQKKDDKENTPLHTAAESGDVSTIAGLLESKADINAGNRWKNTPLHAAACMDHGDIVRTLLKAGANHSAKNVTNESALHQAAFRGNTDGVAALLEAKADVEAKDVLGRTPLHNAVAKPRIVQALLDAKASAFTKDGTGNIPLYWACRMNRGDADGVQALRILALAAVASKIDGESYVECISPALSCGNKVEAVLEAGADVLEAKNYHDLISTAMHRGYITAVKALASKAKVETFGIKQYDKTLLQAAASEGLSEAVQALLAAKADVRVTDADGQTPLHFAACNRLLMGEREGRYDYAQVIRFLVAGKADIEAKDHKGQTLFFLANQKMSLARTNRRPIEELLRWVLLLGVLKINPKFKPTDESKGLTQQEMNEQVSQHIRNYMTQKWGGCKRVDERLKTSTMEQIPQLTTEVVKTIALRTMLSMLHFRCGARSLGPRLTTSPLFDSQIFRFFCPPGRVNPELCQSILHIPAALTS